MVLYMGHGDEMEGWDCGGGRKGRQKKNIGTIYFLVIVCYSFSKFIVDW